jgi:hypothetical protein
VSAEETTAALIREIDRSHADNERLRAEAAILGPELVDLQRQVLLLQSQLEQALRDNGRLRAELEMAQAVREEDL